MSKLMNFATVLNYTNVLINETFAAIQIPFANMFFDIKTIKTKISMLYKETTPRIAQFRYISIVILLFSTIIYTSCTTSKKEELKLQDQISELNKSLKKLDSISLKDLESLDELQMAITSYSVADGQEYAKITNESDRRILDSIYFYMKDDKAYKELLNSPESLALKNQYDSINLRLSNVKRTTTTTKTAQPMFYYNDKDDQVVKEGFLLPRSEDCNVIDESDLKKCLVVDLTNRLNYDITTFVKDISPYIDGLITINFIINEEGRIANVKVSTGPYWESLGYDIVKIMGKYQRYMPAMKDGSAIAVNVQLPLYIKSRTTL